MMTAVRPECQPVKEVRFAVVMYGGVSLAIYIHGVAQELLRLVRATACGDDGRAFLAEGEINGEMEDGQPPASGKDEAAAGRRQLASSEKVYRKLGQYLGRRQGPQKKGPLEMQPDDPIRTRFVVDILSGTSAGGINAIYLAKALANDQTIDEVPSLWINEGDISLLVNDKNSVKGTPLTPQIPPQSLLNSHRMYYRLLEAFHKMEAVEPCSSSPYVDELELYVTTTDLRGLKLPIQLADNTVHERRHRNVFRFRYARADAAGVQDVNSFVSKNNPFLAFAARCTSSFPFAFEPMVLDDIRATMEHFGYQWSDRWQEFYRDYLEAGDNASDFENQAFADGGYLDNKPFSYITESLLRRRADLPVDRKLIYIEPSPEHFENSRSTRKPNALENVQAALIGLPRYETIREDLEVINQRNALIRRVNTILRAEQPSEFREAWEAYATRREWGAEWGQLGLKQMVEIYGSSYVAYHRLRVAAVTKNISNTLARVMGVEGQTDEAVLHELVKDWRKYNYHPDPSGNNSAGNISWQPDKRQSDQKGVPLSSENALLFEYDLRWRLRRLNLLQKVINQLNSQEDSALLTSVQYLLQNRRLDGEQVMESVKALEKMMEGHIDRERVEREARALSKRIPLTLEHGLVEQELKQQLATLKEQVDRYKAELQDQVTKCEVMAEQQPTDSARQDYIGRFSEMLLDNTKPGLNNIYVYLRSVGRQLRAREQSKKDLVAALNGRQKLSDAQEAVQIERIAEDYVQAATNLANAWNDLLNYIRSAAQEPLTKADLCQRLCQKPDPGENLWDQLHAMCGSGDQKHFSEFKLAFTNYDQALRAALKEAMITASHNCKLVLGLPLTDRTPAPPVLAGQKATSQNYEAYFKDLAHQPVADPARIAQLCLQHYYQHYEYNDMLTFPILYGTPVGEEADEVEIYRISPEDATALIDEKEWRRPKLAGTMLGHFGAFFREDWRENDLLWGRLDGAERIICTLMPPSAERDELIKEAHWEILKEKFGDKIWIDEARMFGLASQLQNGLEQLGSSPASADLKAFVRTYLLQSQQNVSPVQAKRLLLDYFRIFEQPDLNLPRRPMLELSARATQVVGDMLKDVSRQNKTAQKWMGSIATVGRAFGAVVQTAVPGPDNLSNHLVKHWLKLLYIFAVLCLVVGTIFAWQIAVLGVAILVGGGALHFTINRLGRYMALDQQPPAPNEVPPGLLKRLGRFVIRVTPVLLATLYWLILIPLAIYGGFQLVALWGGGSD